MASRKELNIDRQCQNNYIQILTNIFKSYSCYDEIEKTEIFNVRKWTQPCSWDQGHFKVKFTFSNLTLIYNRVIRGALIQVYFVQPQICILKYEKQNNENNIQGMNVLVRSFTPPVLEYPKAQIWNLCTLCYSLTILLIKLIARNFLR